MCCRNNPLFHSCYKRQLIVKGPCVILEFSSGGGGGGGLRSIWYINHPFPRFQRRSNIFRGGGGGEGEGGQTSSRGGGGGRVQLLMPRLYLPYDEYTMPVRCPNHYFHVTSAGRPCDHRTDLLASWPLRF